MKKFALFLLAVAALPLVWGVCAALPGLFALAPANDDGAIFSAEAMGLLAGMLAELALWVAFPVPVRLYVLGHEMTHAMVGMLFGAKPSNLRVTVRGGSVLLTKSNVWITLAPYFVPFYTVLVVLAALAVRLWLGRLPCAWAWTFAVGFTYAFHFLFTIRSLRQEQPDIHEYGRLFSWELIFLLNALGVFLWVACTGGVPFVPAAKTLWQSVSETYSFLHESISSLPFLQK